MEGRGEEEEEEGREEERARRRTIESFFASLEGEKQSKAFSLSCHFCSKKKIESFFAPLFDPLEGGN